MLEHTLATTNKHAILQTKQSIMSFTDTKVSYYYKIMYAGIWYDVVSRYGEQLSVDSLLSEFDVDINTPSPEGVVEAINRYYLPKAKHVQYIEDLGG